MRATRLAHPMLPDLVLLIIFSKEYKLRSSFLHFLHPPVTSSLLCANILLSTLFNTFSICLISWTWHTKLDIHTKQQVKLAYIYVHFKDSELKYGKDVKIYSNLSFLMNVILICSRRSKMFTHCHISNIYYLPLIGPDFQICRRHFV